MLPRPEETQSKITSRFVHEPAPVAAVGIELRSDLDHLACLIANVTESYSAVVFLKSPGEDVLIIGGAHTLSRDVNLAARIPFGAGLVGWVAQHTTPVSVCPFENDATTLVYYTTDQALKSFLALPVKNSRGELIAVIACDSKKTYAFSKLAQKLLQDCTVQASKIIELHEKIAGSASEAGPARGLLDETADKLRSFDDERSLLNAACIIPEQLIERDALVVLALSEGGVGEGKFYSRANEAGNGNRLLEMVCRHKRIICSERSVQTTLPDDEQRRSFLSIPFRVLGKEAGSFNLISKPLGTFSAPGIAALEKLSDVVGRELERIRLRSLVPEQIDNTALSSWPRFVIQAKKLLIDSKRRGSSLSLLRMKFTGLETVEKQWGVDSALTAYQKALRIVEQTKGNEALACAVYGAQALIILKAEDATRFVTRLKSLLQRPTPHQHFNIPQEIGRILAGGLVISSASFPKDGESLHQLCSRTAAQIVQDQKPPEGVVDGWNW